MDIEDLKYILQQHAYIVGQSVLATARLEGMKVENERAIQNGLNPPYVEEYKVVVKLLGLNNGYLKTQSIE